MPPVLSAGYGHESTLLVPALLGEELSCQLTSVYSHRSLWPAQRHRYWCCLLPIIVSALALALATSSYALSIMPLNISPCTQFRFPAVPHHSTIWSRLNSAEFVTQDLPSEEAARGCRKAAKENLQITRQKSKGNQKATSSDSKIRTFNLSNYKTHALADYPKTIRELGTTDGYSTQNVSSKKSLGFYFMLLFDYRES